MSFGIHIRVFGQMNKDVLSHQGSNLSFITYDHDIVSIWIHNDQKGEGEVIHFYEVCFDSCVASLYVKLTARNNEWMLLWSQQLAWYLIIAKLNTIHNFNYRKHMPVDKKTFSAPTPQKRSFSRPNYGDFQKPFKKRFNPNF